MIRLYGKTDCGLCAAAKDKLHKLGLNFEALNLEDFTQPHEGWRRDRSCEISAAYAIIDKLPLIEVDGEYHDYPSAMRRLKQSGVTVAKERATTTPEN